MKAYYLGTASNAALVGVHPDLRKVIVRAISLSEVDFRVVEGLRTLARQKTLVAKGASKTLASRHLVGKDEYGHASDLVPLIDFDGDGRAELRWDWSLCYKVAAAMRQASIDLGIPIRWGGVWDKQLSDLGEDIPKAVAAYSARRHAMGKSAFLDGPHFELPAALYP
jgi:peptidoglycan L-alanyl-D-glutamate endopeptidase CwlK